MKRLALCTLLALGLGGCAVEPTRLQPEVTYIAEWVGDAPVIGRHPLSLVLGDDGRAFGSAGCNHWFGSYSLEGERIRFSELGSTRKLCAEAIMRQEQRFLDTLGQVERWDISNIDQLRLWPAEGAPIRLWPAQD
ncbi:META domain-containing protein [Stutzerimonas azotifigens]|uniref:META domain-containing protein n=1 Tax=Stutzerimonas azotifigens TaxID=291995 RepID=UPI0003F879DE|nr:META domain-containing protein [Stutzerimonas azotifigens]